MKGGIFTYPCGFVVFCLVSLTFILTLVISTNGLGPLDDHRFISTIFLGKDFGAYIMPELGRFIPLTAQEYVLCARIFDPSPYLFHIISGIKAFFVGVLLIYGLMLTRAGNWTSAILWSVVIFSIGFANATNRLQIGEINILLLTLLFLLSNLAADKAVLPLFPKHNLAIIGGLVAFTFALFYKELVFIFALAFGASEFLRHYRQMQAAIPRRIWALLLIGASYIVFYWIWRSIYNINTSYSSFHSIALWDIISPYAVNDPFIIFIVLPLTLYRVFLILRSANEHTLFDSFLIAASAYTAAYLALRMFNTYYLLPAYGFAVFGVAGVLAKQTKFKLNTVVLFFAAIFSANTLPVAISDMQSLRNISNNHYQFIQYIAKWVVENPLPNAERRNLVLAGVSPGNGVEVLFSLRVFLLSMGVPEASFDIRASEPTDNPVVTSLYREQNPSLSAFKDTSGYNAKIGDLLIFNPYQSFALPPPLQAPSYRNVYRSDSDWAYPRWLGWYWVNFCVLHHHDCISRLSGSMPFTGYAAMLVTRGKVPVTEAIPLETPSYRIVDLNLLSRMKSGKTVKLDVLVQNTGTETWPADGTLRSGMFVHLAYRWFYKDNQMALEGGRAPFPEPMRPNDQSKVSILLKTPTQAGKYTLVISPVQEGVRWFDPDNHSEIGKEIEVF